MPVLSKYLLQIQCNYYGLAFLLHCRVPLTYIICYYIWWLLSLLKSKKRIMFRNFIAFVFFASYSIVGCNNHKPVIVQPAFYFWKSNNYEFSEAERKYIDTLQLQKLYVKFFEVALDPVFGNAPISKTSLRISKWDSINAEIIPVIFIKNEVFRQISKTGLDSLSNNVVFLVNKMKNEKINLLSKEIQIDCDWTESTKENYFYFLKSLKQLSGKTVSVTLRLYPYKYPDKMGTPPADKAMLMCYNLLNALKNETKNSILDIDELKQYLNQRTQYPLHIDVALPAYSWMLLYKNNQFRGSFNQQNEDLLSILSPVNNLWYEVNRDTVVEEYYLRKGDRIKYENISPGVLLEAAKMVKNNTILQDSVTVSIFHLDEEKLSNYSYEILHNVYTTFSK